MKNAAVSLIAGVVLLAISAVAIAVPATWEFKGHLTLAEGASLPPDFVVGTPFRILVSFETGAADLNSRPTTLLSSAAGDLGGARYSFRAPSLSYTIFLGSTCAPCEPAAEPSFNRSASRIILRDDYNVTDANTGTPTGALDGITFNLVNADGASTNLLMRGPVTDLVTAPAGGTPTIPATPDPRLAGLATATLEYCAFPNDCLDGHLLGQIDSVTVPEFGTNWFLSARDCLYIDNTTTSADPKPHDCIYVDGGGDPLAGIGRIALNGGGAGRGEFNRAIAPVSPFAGPSSGQSLGDVFGSVAFNGPAALPVVKGGSIPSDISRTNANLIAYQRYQYTGTTPTTLPLVVDLTYGIADYSNNPALTSETGLRPGGATMAAMIAIVDGDRVPIAALSTGTNFNALECGAEAGWLRPDGSPWPAGSILGNAFFASADGENNPAAATPMTVTSCANPGQPVQLAAGQSFIVATSIQTPARGRWTLAPGAPAGNGYVDASHTLRVTFDPNAPPALVQKLADSIAPACTDCGFKPEVLPVAVSVRSCVNPRSKGVIPVAIMGSASLDVKDIRLDDSLQLGAIAPGVNGNQKAQCSVTRIDGDAYDDLVCQFPNSAANWQQGQTTATLSGKLVNGVPIAGAAAVCIR